MHLASIGCELKYNLPWMSRKGYNSPLPSRITLIFQDRMGASPVAQWWKSACQCGRHGFDPRSKGVILHGRALNPYPSC